MASEKTVLIVDNDQDVRFVLGAILNHDGYRMIEAADGAEGITVAARHRPDVILMDIHMPGMDGFDAAEAIRRDEWARGIPIVALTSNRFHGARLERSEALFHSCLWKPIEPRQVMAHIRSIIGDP